MLTHHKLSVYQKAVALAASSEEFSIAWGKRHAIVDQFGRASESIVLNIAEAARLHSGADKARSLDVYQAGLEFMRWFVGQLGCAELSGRLCREIDKAGTSVVLNIAEGNGRYSELDHRRFLDMASCSTVKAAAYLDLYQQKALPAGLQITPGRELLSRILAMLNRF